MLGELSLPLKTNTLYASIYMRSLKFIAMESRMLGTRGGGERWVSVYWGQSFEKMKKFRRQMVGMVEQQCEWTELYSYKWLKC